jgi:hypothetical protein
LDFCKGAPRLDKIAMAIRTRHKFPLLVGYNSL